MTVAPATRSTSKFHPAFQLECFNLRWGCIRRKNGLPNAAHCLATASAPSNCEENEPKPTESEIAKNSSSDDVNIEMIGPAVVPSGSAPRVWWLVKRWASLPGERFRRAK